MEQIIKKIVGLSKGYEAFAVGGFARDLLLGFAPADIDLAVNKNALKYSKILAKAFNSKVVALDDEKQTYRIPLKSAPVLNIDVSLIVGKNIIEDLKKRDFTINAFAFDINYYGDYKKHILACDKTAFADLKSKTVSAVSDGVFKDDPLRMLRAFRFCAELNFQVSQKTLKRIKKSAKLIKRSAPERIKNEFFRILACKNSADIIEQMNKCALLGEIFPEIYKMQKASKKYYYHPGGLFEHSFLTLSATEKILNNLNKIFPDNAKELEEYLSQKGAYSENINGKNLLKFAALFHDNAKPETAEKQGTKMRFFGHEEQGAAKLREIMLSLKTSKKDAQDASFLVENHMRPSTLTKNNVVTKRAALKFFRDVKNLTPSLIILAMADWHSYRHLRIFTAKTLKKQEEAAKKLIEQYYKVKNAKPLKKVIDGNIIMKKFKLKPGPWIGDLIKAVAAKQQEGKISDTKGALKAVSEKLTQVKKKYKIDR
ncbi:MAG: HD domain-containing protein [Endomicrobium sp.]|jgi:poly(A) polymerase|nr:HD domain-containing protein [Endomicrobium sp.]